ncbi:N-acetylmuramic acid 6-phosphate etherase, partial [Ruegeria sp. NA]|nr:N-acetylmuramic acid 6-phosphate etherase [Ruegeria sp. NA]
MLSSLMAIKLGHVHEGMMVNLRADNAKLRARATGIVARIAGVDAGTAQNALAEAQGDTKSAILIAARGVSLAAANARLKEAGGVLSAALTPDK